MSDYQAIYDAVRSRFSPVSAADITQVVRECFDISWQKQHLQQEIYAVSAELRRPSAVYRPTLMADGDKWCALLGDDLQSGVAGFGDTPAEAMTAFDKAFLGDRTPTAKRLSAA